ncbi:MAG: tRNA-(ms[2]io[6]A)-hydroxylase [Deltaproteobacteria bacterium]|nr:tRNA-(ms[2]io[6]A)-hydroxylase [Deltaproteobacteria bacterium]
MLRLRTETGAEWLRTVLADLDGFLQDHGANERKASASAVLLAVHYPERRALVDAMVELAREELEHFAQVYAVLARRGLTLGIDSPDPYMGALTRLMRKGHALHFLLDRLLVFGIVEARGCERFGILAEALPDAELRAFYAELTRSEARHHGLFVRLAYSIAPRAEVNARLDALLDAEQVIIAELPVRAAVH